ncbi:DHHA1 domain protein [Clostridiales bacterium oral taxon 876 str. F0540]|nr:DHHA1 domain protein [Clostridiales bacterium oral taxon 876 str. F0540]
MINNVTEMLIKSTSIGITFHVSPDGDSLGSALALMLSLKKLGKEAYIVSDDKIPETYSFLPCLHSIVDEFNFNQNLCDCIIVLDCGNYERISAKIDSREKKYTLLNIDHHISNDLYGDINYVDTKASSVGEIIYEIIKMLNIELDEEIATCIYTSIVSDTGAFKHSNTTSKTHIIVSDLLSYGVKFNDIHRLIFENKKFEHVKLIGKVIDSAYLTFNNKVCIMRLTKKMLEDLNMELADTSDIVNLGMGIDIVEAVVLIKESDDYTKVSLRSKSSLDVRKVAESFGGGGHVRAAGATLKMCLEDAEKAILKVVEKELIL